MNLALLDPFRRQVPDRIDSTLTLGSDLHPPLPTNRKPLTIPRRLATASSEAPSDRTSQDDDVKMADVSSSSAPPAAPPSSPPTKRAEWSIPAAEDWISCHSVAFNRRGTYLAAGHLSGAVPIHDTLSRTVSAVYRPPATVYRPPAFGEGVESPSLTESDVRRYTNKEPSGAEEQFEYRNGVTSLSWSKRSRLLLVAAVGDRNIRLVDNEHPSGVDAGEGNIIGGDDGASASAADGVASASGSAAASSPISVATGNGEDGGGEDSSVAAQSRSSGASTPATKKRKKSDIGADRDETATTPSIKKKTESFASVKCRILPPADIITSSDSISQEELEAHCRRYGPDEALGGGDRKFAACQIAADEQTDSQQTYTRYHTQILPLPNAVGASVELHPRDCHAGFAVLADGSLILFRFPIGGYVDKKSEVCEKGKRARAVYVVNPGGKYFVTDAAFGHDGSELYAVTKCGSFLGFRIGTDVLKMLRSPITLDPVTGDAPQTTTLVDQPAFCIKIPGGAAAWQLVVSRNGRLILINSADCALRLFGAEECWQLAKKAEGQRTDDVKPRYVFQDLVSKIAWSSCAFSGDAEYVVGGCNSNPHMGDRYDLYIWNTGTGALIDQLNGPQAELHDVDFHPTRPFIAVATSDGIVDTWGPRMDWTNFAPSFQALPMNIEYAEKEDEFDVVIDGDGAEEERKRKETEAKLMEEGKVVDVTTVDRVPVFDSDSEGEGDVFRFDTRIACTMKPRAASV
eukprot:CAMPEP_0181032916 /NCGR_PEP_ID=MMETSP1070-20121207/6982_1 /TAXON_ID=265543 /ORGANISM="Minutocellus polymorphus, Strain NH13" /LENGTH=743 /DNA_ID=CAMNT_0023110315 /DNA_START=33 /DNA_END=2261 /DNA_ORIENTATION=-